jgi:hypothetical protein
MGHEDDLFRSWDQMERSWQLQQQSRQLRKANRLQEEILDEVRSQKRAAKEAAEQLRNQAEQVRKNEEEAVREKARRLFSHAIACAKKSVSLDPGFRVSFGQKFCAAAERVYSDRIVIQRCLENPYMAMQMYQRGINQLRTLKANFGVDISRADLPLQNIKVSIDKVIRDTEEAQRAEAIEDAENVRRQEEKNLAQQRRDMKIKKIFSFAIAGSAVLGIVIYAVTSNPVWLLLPVPSAIGWVVYR